VNRASLAPRDTRSPTIPKVAWSRFNKVVVRFGEAIETPLDIINEALDAASFVRNIADGNYGAAAIDAVALVLDGAAVAAPGVPGVAGAGVLPELGDTRNAIVAGNSARSMRLSSCTNSTRSKRVVAGT
jgi:hypothetical protein